MCKVTHPSPAADQSRTVFPQDYSRLRLGSAFTRSLAFLPVCHICQTREQRLSTLLEASFSAMQKGNEDTDTLLALLASLLDTPVDSTLILLNALADSSGDIYKAAHSLNKKRGKSRECDDNSPRASKRKKHQSTGSLSNWLVKPSTLEVATADAEEDVIEIAGVVESPRKVSKKDTQSSSPTKKPTVDLMTVLRQAPSSITAPARLPPLTLSTPELIANHLPCTFHSSVLPPELALKLFYVMLDLSKDWKHNKWWLFDRVVESPHKTSFFVRKNDRGNGNEGWHEAAQYWYNGRPTEPPMDFPPAMEEACVIIERVVNEELKKRKRFPLEWAPLAESTDGDSLIWRANVAASNCYEGGKESVGFHSDQLTYLGPYPTIASLSLGTSRIFRLRETIPADEIQLRQARTYNIPLPHNSLTIMHASCQERFKHSIPPQPTIDLFRPSARLASPDLPLLEPSNARINVTFRFYRPDFAPSSIPRCDCGVPAVLRPDMKKKGRAATAQGSSSARIGDERLNDTEDHTAALSPPDKQKYWWSCYAGAQNEGKGCKFWKVLDIEGEGRGPVVGDGNISRTQNNDSSI